jgi:hypothetical protein
MDQSVYVLLYGAVSCTALIVYYTRGHDRRAAVRTWLYMFVIVTAFALVDGMKPDKYELLLRSTDPADQTAPFLLRAFDRPSDPPPTQVLLWAPRHAAPAETPDPSAPPTIGDLQP